MVVFLGFMGAFAHSGKEKEDRQPTALLSAADVRDDCSTSRLTLSEGSFQVAW